MFKTFDFDPANKMAAVAEVLDSMQDYLSQLRMKSVEENRAMLMVEESLVSLAEHADPERPQRITVKASRLLGTLTISLTVPGQEFPFSEKVMPLGFPLEEEEEGDQARVIRGLILQSFGSRLKYKHRDGKNTVRIEAQRSPYSFLYQTMSCLLAAVLLGILCILTPTLILSYYAVVGGWSITYLLRSFTLAFPSFGSFSSSGWACTAFGIYLALSCIIVAGGVKKGIETFSKISIPILFILIVGLAVYSVTLKGGAAGIDYMLKPDWSKVGARTFVNAIGQSFYSISLGMGIIITYASYISKKENIVISGIGTAGFDLFFAVLAGFVIMPAVFAAGIEPGSGPGLIFDTLPFIFVSMSEASPLLATVVAVAFFLTVTIAALTSSVSLVEVPVAWLIEEKKMKRGSATLLVFAVTGIIGAFCALNLGVFDWLDKVCCNVLLPIGGILCVIFVGWIMKKDDVRDEFTSGGIRKGNQRLFAFAYFLVKYVAPVAVAVIFISNFI